MKYAAFFLILLISCSTSGQKKIAGNANSDLEYQSLISYNEENDPEPHHVRNIKDTLTPHGWKIEHFVKNDSTKHKDLHIQWSHNNVKRTWQGSHLLELQSYFTPVFKSETQDYLFMEFEVRGGDGVLILPKDPTAPFLIFPYIVGYSAIYGQVAYIPEASYSSESLDVEVYDLKSGKTKSVQFNERCSVLPENACLLKASFSKTLLTIFANTDGSDKPSEIKTIKF